MSLGRAFRNLWAANAASNFADGLAFVAIPLLAASLTNDPRWIAGLSALYAVVRLVVALPIGVWVDRFDRRTILVVANLFRGGAVLALALCVTFGIGGLPLLYVAFATIGALESAADNAAISLLPSLIPPKQLDKANGQISATQLVADEFVGPPLGGLLFTAAAAAPIFAMGGLWAAAGLIALALPMHGRVTRAPSEAPAPAWWSRVAEGAQWIMRHRTVRGLALIGALASVGYMLPFSVLVIFAQQRLQIDAAGYGVVLAFSAIGGLLATATCSWFRAKVGYRWTIIASLLTGAVSLLALATTREPVLASVYLAIYIFHAVIWGICATSLRQQLVPDSLRGRVNATTQVLGLIGLGLGASAAGLLATLNIVVPVATGGLVFIACAALAFCLLPSGKKEAPRPKV